MEKASDAADRAIRLTLSTTSPSYRIGDTVTGVLHALSAEDVWTDLQELEIVFCGVERVDTAWVSRAYRRKVAPINTDKRRVQRLVVLSRLQAATQGNFSDADFRRFVVRFTLPNWLPPSYKGTAVRYSYYLEAVMRYKKDGPDAPVPLSFPDNLYPDNPPPEPPALEIGVTSVRLPVLIWPAKERTTGEAPGPDVFPALASDAVPIKCWEIGSGTAVADAITHITSLGTTLPGSSPIPNTPSFAHREESRTDVSETASEISHEEARTPQVPHHRRAPSVQLPSDLDPAPLLASLQGDHGPYRSYWLRTGPHPVARVSLQPPQEGAGLRPGSTLGGTIEFPSHSQSASLRAGEESNDGPTPRCIQLSLSLESEESVNGEWQPPSKGAGAPLRRLHDEHFEVTTDLGSTSFLFTLPLDATPSFATPLLVVQWLLRFQFTVRGGTGEGEVLTWTLPLLVESPA